MDTREAPETGSSGDRSRRACGYRGCTEPASVCDGCGAEGCDDALRKACRCEGGPDAIPLYEPVDASVAETAFDAVVMAPSAVARGGFVELLANKVAGGPMEHLGGQMGVIAETGESAHRVLFLDARVYEVPVGWLKVVRR